MRVCAYATHHHLPPRRAGRGARSRGAPSLDAGLRYRTRRADAYLGIGGPDDQRELPFAALGRSGHSDTAREMEELLEQEWTADAGGR
jgi:hypothetical protein